MPIKFAETPSAGLAFIVHSLENMEAYIKEHPSTKVIKEDGDMEVRPTNLVEMRITMLHMAAIYQTIIQICDKLGIIPATFKEIADELSTSGDPGTGSPETAKDDSGSAGRAGEAAGDQGTVDVPAALGGDAAQPAPGAEQPAASIERSGVAAPVPGPASEPVPTAPAAGNAAAQLASEPDRAGSQGTGLL